MSYIDTCEIRINSNHLDLIGHVNNATYLQLMEHARWSMYNKFGFTQATVKEIGKGPIVVETHIKYRKEITLNEVVKIVTQCLDYNGMLGTIQQKLYKENSKLSSIATFKFGYFDLNDRKLVRASGVWENIHCKLLS